MPEAARVEPLESVAKRPSVGLGNWHRLVLLVLSMSGVDCSFPSHSFVSLSDANTGGSNNGGASATNSDPAGGTSSTSGGNSDAGSLANGGFVAAGSAPSSSDAGSGLGSAAGSNGGTNNGSGGVSHAGSGANRGGTAGIGGNGTATLVAGNTGHPSENCANGIDDDGDGQVDCDDSDCANWRCVAAVPSGWSGPVVIGPRSASMPDLNCSTSGGFATSVTSRWCSSLSTASYRCGACQSCGNASGLDVSVQITYTKDCSSSLCSDPAKCTFKIDESCPAIELQQAWLGADPRTLSVATGPVNVSGGTCPTLAEPTILSTPESACTQWNQVCKGNTTGICSRYSGGLCLPKPSDPFGPKVCIFSDSGETKCPQPWDADTSVYWADTTDSRGCAACTCSLPSPGEYPSASGMVSAYTNSVDCLAHPSAPSGIAYTDNGTPCTGRVGATFPNSVDTKYIALWFAPGTEPSVSCRAGGGNPTGKAEGTSPVTVCCM